MKYFLTVLITAIVVSAAAYIYFRGVPKMPSYSSQPVSTQSSEVAPPSPPISSPSPSPSDETSLIIADIKAGLVAEHGPQASSMTVTVGQIIGDYATGMANDTGGGGIWFGAKVNGVWKLVWDGNGIILCSDLVNYPKFPSDLIPSCWDPVSQKSITR